jgi:hypothetical protein
MNTLIWHVPLYRLLGTRDARYFAGVGCKTPKDLAAAIRRNGLWQVGEGLPERNRHYVCFAPRSGYGTKKQWDAALALMDRLGFDWRPYAHDYEPDSSLYKKQRRDALLAAR